MSPSWSSRLLICPSGIGSSPRNAHPLAPTHLRERVAQVLPELVDLPAQIHVVEQRVRELLQLRALLGRHRVHELLHLRHRTRHLLEQLVERLRVPREEVAEAIHEPFEVGLLAALALLEHLVELGEHVLHACELLGRHLRHALLQLIEHGVEQLLAQLVHQLLELLAGRVVHPVVLLQLADAPGEIGRQLLELLAPLLRELFEELLAPLVARLAGVVEAAIDAFALLLDDLVEPLGDVLVHAAEVVAVELLPAPLAQLLEHLAHALDVATLAVLEALLQHPSQRGVQIAVVQEIVGHLLEQRVGVEIEPDLRAVPPRVPELAHRATVPPAGIAASRPHLGITRVRIRGMAVPSDFWWGTAASSTQAEGAAPASDWYASERAGRVPPSGRRQRLRHALRRRLRVVRRSTGSPTTASSIEWARIEPEEGAATTGAIEHYRADADGGARAGINPWVCLHHFTLPGWFTEIGEGGFLDDRARSYYWARHVAFCAETFGDLVFGWKPINEPGAYVVMYRTGGRSPRSATGDACSTSSARRAPRAARRLARAARGGAPGRDDPQPVARLRPGDDACPPADRGRDSTR